MRISDWSSDVCSSDLLGGALEFYDFVVFVFFAIPLSQLFFPHDTAPWLAQLQVFGIFAAGYLARPLGGIVMAHYGDKLGRKRMFTLSVFLMAVPTLGIGRSAKRRVGQECVSTFSSRCSTFH